MYSVVFSIVATEVHSILLDYFPQTQSSVPRLIVSYTNEIEISFLGPKFHRILVPGPNFSVLD